MYKLIFFVPESHLEHVKKAIFAAGAGKLGNYDQCCWQASGQGQFRPLPGSNPFVGQTNQLETVREFKVETVCADEHIKAAIAALRESHPYEEPAFDVLHLFDVEANG